MATVMVVDDETDIRSVLAMVLELEGHTALTAANGRDALDQLAGTAVDAILLDIQMPVMDAYAFVPAYRAVTANPAPIVVISASQRAERFCRELGCAGWLGKPFDLDDILTAVADAIAART